MASLETLAFFLLTLAIAYFCGYGVVRLLLPEEYLQEFAFVIMPPVGYCVFSWMVFNTSGSLNISGEKAVIISLALTGVLAVLAFFRKPRQPVFTGIRDALPLSLCITVFVLWPLFYVGSDTFLGAVNPDYAATFLDLHYLKDYSLTEEKFRQSNSYSYFSSVAGTVSKSARFASCYFVLLVQSLLPISMRSAMTLSIGVFLFCLPLSVYFMARAAFGFGRRAAMMSSCLVGISGPVAMSYVYFYVGQNSGLGVLPVVLACLYLLVTRPSWRILVLSTLLVNSLYVMYAAMVPYAAAPIAVVALYLILKKQLSFFKATAIALGIAFTTILLNLGNLKFLAGALLGWSKIVALSLQGQYFIDFLTERFFPIFFGLVSYPVGSSLLALAVGDHLVYVIPVLIAVVLIALTLSALHWIRTSENKSILALGLGAAAVYGAVWYLYTFHRQYGYAVFKMSSWLQFIYVLPLGFGLDLAVRELSSSKARRKRLSSQVLFASLAVIIMANLMSSYQLLKYSLGKDPGRGFIVNSYDMSGNYDYLNLASDVSRLVRRDQSVGISFVDSIQHEWISYYLRDFRISWLGHYLIPGDDENLPDIVTRRVADYYGNVAIDRNFYFNGATDDFYLTWNEAHTNKEILAQPLPQPLWQNRTFRLFRASECPDFLFLGRGWYRLEFPIKGLDHWLPERLRWSAEGGEIYMLRASKPNEPYRLSFIGVVGHGLNSSKRTIELWHNARKFDEFQIDVAARIVSEPFFPTAGADRLVIKVRESVKPIARRYRLWNQSVPGDYRKLNLMGSEIKVLPPGVDTAVTPYVSRLEGSLLFSESVRFNGLHLDRWIGESAFIAYRRPDGASQLLLNLSVPDHKALVLPLKIRVWIDQGKEQIVMATKPGPMKITAPLDPRETPVTEIRLQPERSFVPDGVDTEDKPVRIGVRLESVEFDLRR